MPKLHHDDTFTKAQGHKLLFKVTETVSCGLSVLISSSSDQSSGAVRTLRRPRINVDQGTRPREENRLTSYWGAGRQLHRSARRRGWARSLKLEPQ